MATHKARKRFGQHFLCDESIIQRIVTALAPQSDQHLVEIGPGRGALTTPILQQLKRLEVIELDRDLVVELQTRYQHLGELIVHAGDVLAFDFDSIRHDARKLRVFGNLPYNISTPLLFHLLEYAPIVQDMVFMLQKEVGLRLAARPSSSDYGRLSVMVQYFCRVEILFHVPPQAFSPPPQVQSSIVHLSPYSPIPYPAHNFALFAAVVKQAFGQRRKTLRKSLKGMIKDTVWENTGIRSDLRPENLSVQQFVEISNAAGENV